MTSIVVKPIQLVIHETTINIKHKETVQLRLF
jgi:hypothetical protein